MMKMSALRAKPSSLIVPKSVFISINLLLCDIFGAIYLSLMWNALTGSVRSALEAHSPHV